MPPSASGTPDTAPAAAAPAQGKGDPYTIDIDDGDDDDLVEVVEVEVERAGAAMPRRPLRVVQQQPLASEAAATAGPAEPAKLPGVNAFEVMRRVRAASGVSGQVRGWSACVWWWRNLDPKAGPRLVA